MLPVYTLEQLQAKKRPALWKICETLEIPKHVKNADCIEAILAKMPAKIEVTPVTDITTENENGTGLLYVNGTAIATISYDESDDHMPWVVSVNEVEIHRAFTWAQVKTAAVSRYREGRLPKLVIEVVSTEPEVVENKEGKEVPATFLKKGDRIIHDNKIWVVEGIKKFPTCYQENHSTIYGEQTELRLLPADYKMQEHVWGDRSDDPVEFDKFCQHLRAETVRLSAATKWLKPLTNTRFVLVQQTVTA